MRFSIVTITKNNPTGFARTQKSVQSQSYSDFEWVVIDGDIEPDNGIYDAMNKGIARANGEYVIFMNAGDEFASPDVLECLSKIKADFIYSDAIEDGFVKRSKHVSRIKNGMITHHQAMVYRARILKNLRYDERYSLAADYKLTLEFIILSNCICYINLPLCIFEVGGLSQRNVKDSRYQEIAIRRELNISAPLTPYRQWMAQMVRKYCPWAYQLIKK